MTRRQWGLVIIMILINYLIFSQLFRRITETSEPVVLITPTVNPTFTVTSTTIPIPPKPTETPIPPTPTATNTSVIMTDEQREFMYATQTSVAVMLTATAAPPTNTPDPEQPTATPTEARRAEVTASDSTVNLRTGPGTNYPRAGSLRQGQSLEIVGRNANSTWWQVSTVNGLVWVAASVTSASNTASVPEVPIPPAPVQPTAVRPTNTPKPTEPPAPSAQFTLSNMFGEVNQGITQVRGHIKDSGGNAVNGVRVRVRSGSFCTVSYPSGPPTYPVGNYDILLDGRAKDGQWLVAVVDGPADPGNTKCDPGLTALSEEVTAQTDSLKGVTYVEWVKHY